MQFLARLFKSIMILEILAIGNISGYDEILIDPDRPGDFNQALMDLIRILRLQLTLDQRIVLLKFSAAYKHGTMDPAIQVLKHQRKRAGSYLSQCFSGTKY